MLRMTRPHIVADLGMPIILVAHFFGNALTVVAMICGVIWYSIEIWESDTRKQFWITRKQAREARDQLKEAKAQINEAMAVLEQPQPEGEKK
jgi:hypothetical protein